MAVNSYALTFGTTIQYGPAGGPATTTLANVDSIDSLPTLTYDETETTRIDQANAIKQFAATLADPGELKLTLGWKKADLSGIYGLSGLLKNWKITIADGGTTQSTLVFDGWMKVIGPKSEGVGGEILLEITIRVSGAVTVTPGT